MQAIVLNRRSRLYIILSALLALFLGALDTLIMSAATPSVVADLGGLPLYSWVFSAYLLSRAIALPVFGKLADLYSCKHLFSLSIGLFLLGSLTAGMAASMPQLIWSRALQGIGAGGNFALVYIVLADIAAPAERGKMMSRASIVWGIASVAGPSLGGFVVNYFSWRWVFFLNLPLGALSLAGMAFFFEETRSKQSHAPLDLGGILALTASILGLLLTFLLAGRRYSWFSAPITGLLAATMLSAIVFYHIEKKAPAPVLPLELFQVPAFRSANAACFFSSFAIFSLAAFAPLFIQGALGRKPIQLGLAMIPLSLAWSAGAWLCGQLAHRYAKKLFTVIGTLLLLAASGWMLTFDTATSLLACSAGLALAGLGMGLVSIATLLIVQESLPSEHLGVATAGHQFTRTLGGAIGVGISGSLLTTKFNTALQQNPSAVILPAELSEQLRQSIETLFRPDILGLVAPQILKPLQQAVGQGVIQVFGMALLASALGVLFGLVLPSTNRRPLMTDPKGK